MKILFVNMTPFYHNTSANIRMCGVIAGAFKNGHTIDLITMKADEDDYSYEPEKDVFCKKYIHQYFTFNKSSIYQSLKEKGIDKRKSVFWGIKSMLKALYRKFEIYDSQFVNVKNILSVDVDFNEYDRIVTVSDPKSSNRLVYELIRNERISNFDKKWIQYWGDPWLIDIAKDYGWKKILIKMEEARLLSKAYKIVYTSPVTMEEQKKIYKEARSKMSCVSQSAKGIEDRANGERRKHCAKHCQSDLLGYIGGYSSNIRNIRPLYDCCVENEYRLDIIGEGDKEIKSKGTVRVASRISQIQAEEAENNVDILVCLCNNRGTQIPGKIFYTAILNKPIIVILDGERKKEIGNYLKTFQRYILCNNDKESIHQAINKALKHKQSGKEYTISDKLKDTYCAKRLIED